MSYTAQQIYDQILNKRKGNASTMPPETVGQGPAKAPPRPNPNTGPSLFGGGKGGGYTPPNYGPTHGGGNPGVGDPNYLGGGGKGSVGGGGTIFPPTHGGGNPGDPTVGGPGTGGPSAGGPWQGGPQPVQIPGEGGIGTPGGATDNFYNRGGGGYLKKFTETPSILKANPGLMWEQDSKTYADPESMVDNQMARILGEDSKYMKQAEARGRAMASSKGMSSSTQGIAAVEGARIAAALPMAQQNAAVYAKLNENEQTADIAKDMATHNFGFQKQLKAMDISANEKAGYMGMMASLNNTLMEGIYGIMSNPNLSDKSQAIQNQIDQWKSLAKTFSQFVGFNLNI